MKKLIIVIPARKGSKRLKNKNIIKLGAKSLVERSIIFAKKIVPKNCIILTTDSEIIKKIGKKSGIICPWLRPPSLSKDKSSSAKVVLHAVRWYIKNIDKIKSILLLQPTTPFRNLNFFKNVIKVFFNDSRKNYISVSEQNLKKKFSDKFYFKKNILNKMKNRRYFVNGSLYLISCKEFLKRKSFYTDNSIGIVVKRKKYSIDIDYLKDLNQARKYI